MLAVQHEVHLQSIVDITVHTATDKMMIFTSICGKLEMVKSKHLEAHLGLPVIYRHVCTSRFEITLQPQQ